MEVDRLVASEHVPYLKAFILLLNFRNHFCEGQFLGVDLPAVPKCSFDLVCQFDFEDVRRLTCLHDGHCQVEEGIPMIFLFDLLQQLD